MKFLGVPGVFDYAGLNGNSRYRPCSCCLPRITKTSASGLHLFEARLPTPPIPLFTLRSAPHGAPTQNSGPSGSLILTRENFAFSASCRFIPAHCNRDFSPVSQHGLRRGLIREMPIHSRQSENQACARTGKSQHKTAQTVRSAPDQRRGP